jgi:hypothetical protein
MAVLVNTLKIFPPGLISIFSKDIPVMHFQLLNEFG